MWGHGRRCMEKNLRVQGMQDTMGRGGEAEGCGV